MPPVSTHHTDSYTPSAHHYGSGGSGAGSSSGDETHGPAEWSISPREFWKKTIDTLAHHTKRMDDSGTLGGNAHSGNSGNVDGGSVYNPDTTMNEGMPTLMNMNSNNAGTGGGSKSGCAGAGKTSSAGSGGNASSGNSGTAHGGSVSGAPSGMINVDSNNAGGAGETETGCATGGDSHAST
ncbi:unnamed protein product [Somion occarium]|uniref:Period circadian protein n=1 Tax=Somion occarium TaxID=3059160 RepID=A0ABP1CLJ5_9APHY